MIVLDESAQLLHGFYDPIGGSLAPLLSNDNSQLHKSLHVPTYRRWRKAGKVCQIALTGIGPLNQVKQKFPWSLLGKQAQNDALLLSKQASCKYEFVKTSAKRLDLSLFFQGVEVVLQVAHGYSEFPANLTDVGSRIGQNVIENLALGLLVVEVATAFQIVSSRGASGGARRFTTRWRPHSLRDISRKVSPRTAHQPMNLA